MHLKTLSDDQLHETNLDLAEKQRRITLDQLNHLNETEARRLYSKYKCSSLHAYCEQELKMDGGTASRYVSAARLLVELPEVEARILDGTTQMTSVSEAGVFFRKEQKAGQTFSLEEKRELVAKLDEKSTREVARILISESSNPEIHFKEKLIPKTESITELILHLDQETMALLERAKEIWSHAMPQAKLSDVIKRSLRDSVEREDPLEKAKRSEARAQKKAQDLAAPLLNADSKHNSTPAPARESKTVVKRQVWRRDDGKCTFVDPRTGECCDSRHFVEEDHIIPKAMGGEYTTENIRLRCRAHNQRHAIESYGDHKMSQYLN